MPIDFDTTVTVSLSAREIASALMTDPELFAEVLSEMSTISDGTLEELGDYLSLSGEEAIERLATLLDTEGGQT